MLAGSPSCSRPSATRTVFFYLRLLSQLQHVGTVPAIDYGVWSDFLDVYES